MVQAIAAVVTAIGVVVAVVALRQVQRQRARPDPARSRPRPARPGRTRRQAHRVARAGLRRASVYWYE